MRRARSLAVLVASLTISVPALLPAEAATPSGVGGLTASVSGSTVTVGGSASFGGQDPVVVGDDAANDNAGGANTAPLGVDLDRMLISQPDPSSPILQFTFDLSSLTNGGIPEHVAYNWDIKVDGGSAAEGSDLSLKSWRTKAVTTNTLDPYAAVFTCVPSATGGSSCSPGPQVPVTYDGTASEIRLSVPFDAIGASPGSTIDSWLRISSPVWIGGTAGTQTASGLYDTGTHTRYTVPTKTVRLGIAPVGSPIDYSTAATLNGSSFSGALTAPGPGTYSVGARACFGTNCGESVTTVTVA